MHKSMGTIITMKFIRKENNRLIKKWKAARFWVAFSSEGHFGKTKKFTQRFLSFRKVRKTDSIPLRILRFFFSLRETILKIFIPVVDFIVIFVNKNHGTYYRSH